MAENLKVLGQVDLVAGTPATLYTCGVSFGALIKRLVFVNRDANVTPLVRARIGIAGASLNVKQYLAYDVQINPATIGETVVAQDLLMANTDILVVQSDTANVSCYACGLERT